MTNFPQGYAVDQDLTAVLRDATVAALVCYREMFAALGGAPVEPERIDVVQSGDMPRIAVYAEEAGTIRSVAGGAPNLDVTVTIVVQALVQRAVKDDAVADLDCMIREIKDCLLRDPGWLTLLRVRSVRTQRSFRAVTEQVIGDGRVAIEVHQYQQFVPRIFTPLSVIGITVAVPATTS